MRYVYVILCYLLAISLANAEKLPVKNGVVSLDKLDSSKLYHIGCQVTRKEFYDTGSVNMSINHPGQFKPGGKIVYSGKEYPLEETIRILLVGDSRISLKKITPTTKGLTLIFQRADITPAEFDVTCDAQISS